MSFGICLFSNHKFVLQYSKWYQIQNTDNWSNGMVSNMHAATFLASSTCQMLFGAFHITYSSNILWLCFYFMNDIAQILMKSCFYQHMRVQNIISYNALNLTDQAVSCHYVKCIIHRPRNIAGYGAFILNKLCTNNSWYPCCCQNVLYHIMTLVTEADIYDMH